MKESMKAPIRTLDTKGLMCPLPVLRARKALKTIEPGDELIIEATDPAARSDFVAFCETTGCDLVSVEEESGVLTLHLRKPSGSRL